MSRAAVLLHMSAQLEAGPRARIERRMRATPEGPLYEDDGFVVPRMPMTGERFRLLDRPAMVLREPEPAARAQLAAELFRRPDALRAARLANVCLADDDELTRVAAAVLAFRLSVDPRPSIATLAEGTTSDDPLVREVAATALARVAPRHEALDRLRAARPAADGGAATQTTMLIHGTWARGSEWWQPPDGSFHTFLAGGWRPDLYGAADRFEWSGGYSSNARLLACDELVAWITDHNEDGIRLITHSHGGSVAFLASWAGPSLGELVVLSCPVREEYVPNFPKIARVVSVRVKWDLVILVDGGGQKFEDPRIREIVLPVWFNHSATHDSDVWVDNGIAAGIDAP